MYGLTGKVAIVTGASSGIGKAIALRLAKEGADVVVVCDRDVSSGKKVAQEVMEMGTKSLFVKADVSKSNDVDQLIKKTFERFGKIDILVNNAGIVRIDAVTEVKEEDWDAIFNVNVKGAFLCARAAAKEMIKQKAGKIINISSTMGKTGFPFFSAYSASKAAIIGLTQSLARELAPLNIRVNAVCPGVISGTKMRKWLAKEFAKRKLTKERMGVSAPPLGIGTPEDVARVVLFLASEESDYLIGQALNVDGGTEMH
jgi:NAD(P)-dependent dehydrogenase (short-subunit alcohol dehydrogenase family)